MYAHAQARTTRRGGGGGGREGGRRAHIFRTTSAYNLGKNQRNCRSAGAYPLLVPIMCRHRSSSNPNSHYFSCCRCSSLQAQVGIIEPWRLLLPYAGNASNLFLFGTDDARFYSFLESRFQWLSGEWRIPTRQQILLRERGKPWPENADGQTDRQEGQPHLPP